MRMLVLLLLPIAAFGQAEKRTRDLLDEARRLPEVKAYCEREPEGVARVEIDGMVIPVDCRLWHLWWRSEQEKKNP